MRVYLSSLGNGLKGADAEECAAAGRPAYLLQSFFYRKHCETALKFVEKQNFMLDSGAFSFMNGAETSKEKMEKYIINYIEFINKHDIKYFFEIDVDSIYGLSQTEAWREKTEKETGKKTIPVWHRRRGVEYWKDMVSAYKYVAVGGQVQRVFKTSRQDYACIKKMVDYAYSKGVKVHGLGFTKTKELQDYKYYSVDSSSWSAGAFRGNTVYRFNGRRIVQRRIKTANKVDQKKLAKHNFAEWCKYQRYMDGAVL